MHSRWARIQPSAEQVRLEAALCIAIVASSSLSMADLARRWLGAALWTSDLARSSPVQSRFGQEQPSAQQVLLGAALCTAGLARSSLVGTRFG